MRGVIVVESQQEFDGWMASQKPEYLKAFPELDPNKTPSPDSSKTVAQAASTRK